MKRFLCHGLILLGTLVFICGPVLSVRAGDLDEKVQRFLESHKDQWKDLNVPWADGQTLHDLIVRHKYTRALEIGTSIGHSTIWIARAMARTGGKVTTIEIDPERHRQARAHFKEAGVEAYIDARLGDAHQLAKELEGPFDFVFSDADKGWYTQYLKDVLPKLEINGCFTAHNTSMQNQGITDFLEYLGTVAELETTVDNSTRAGLSISYKRR